MPPDEVVLAAPRTPLDDLVREVEAGDGADVPLELGEHQQLPVLEKEMFLTSAVRE